jgi:4-hydroxy-tetrahydrodipicolinate reductase
LRLFREGEVEHMFWSLDGKPVSSIRTEREDSGHATAACLFNRIPDVVAARPGIVLLSEMGPMKHTALA